MKKMLFFAAIALAALGSCTSDEFVGENKPNETNENYANAIVFGTGVKTVTRADKTGDAAAALLNSEFVFAGTKSDGNTDPTSFVFDQYTAKWVENTAHTTESNSNDWEYVSYSPATTTSLPSGAEQTIKYWDYAAKQYDFAAYSLGLGAGTTPTYATASAINVGTKSYTLTGSADQLAACYISDLVTAFNHDGAKDFGNVVQFKFRSLGAKIRLAFYETIPGYSVKEVKFYTSSAATTTKDDGTNENVPTLFAPDAVLPSGNGTMTVSFPTTGWGNRNKTDYNKAHVAFSATNSSTDLSTKLAFDALDNFSAAEKKEDNSSSIYLGRASNAATYAGGLVSSAGKYYTVLPYETGANLTLRIKYTLVSTDGSSEEITVDKASAVIPAELAKWNPNYAYTYIFKISDMTNGSTGVDGSGNVVTGLTPITLDAVVVNSEDGVQETITTVSTPSITTYAQGKVVTENDEYIASVPVYIIVNNGTSNVELTVGTNAKLFTATVQTDAVQTISEASVANAFDNGTYDSSAKTYTVTDANGKTLILTDTESTLLSAVTQIDAADSPTGNAITVNGAKFTPAAAGTTYVFQYMTDASVTGRKYDAETAATYNAKLPGAISTGGIGYSFTSYGSNTGSPEYGTGKVKVVSQANGWTTVLVISNYIESFVGNQYKVNSTTLDTNTFYELYTTDGIATGIYVKIQDYTLTDADVNAYNAKLPSAVKDNDPMPDIPAKYQYKIIKIKE